MLLPRDNVLDCSARKEISSISVDVTVPAYYQKWIKKNIKSLGEYVIITREHKIIKKNDFEKHSFCNYWGALNKCIGK